MRSNCATIVALGAAMLLGGCGQAEDSTLEKGQVVATVNGTDVTVYELNTELRGTRLPSDPKQRKLAEQTALQQIVNRKILADLAIERKLDKSPEFLLQERRAKDALLVQLLQQQIASKVPKPSRQDAERYMAQNPGLFAQRKIFAIDQIEFAPPADAAKLQEFKPLKTLAEIEQKLTAEGTPYQRKPTALDSVGVNPSVLKQIVALPPGEVFIVPNGRALTANVITEARIQPFAGDQAINYATNLIMQQRIADAAKRDLEAQIEAARKGVKYQEGFAPPAASAGAAPAKS